MNKSSKLKAHYDVIIIGAGVSGIVAGHTLYNNDHNDFVILESSDKIGGRIRVKEFENNMYATGAGWLHGRKNNPLYELAKKLEIAIEKCAIVGDHIYYAVDSESGNDVSEIYMEKRKKLFYDLNQMYENLEQNNEKIDLTDSVMDIVSRYEKLPIVNNLDRTVISTTQEIFNGAEWKYLSAIAELKLEDEIYGDNFVNYRILDPYGIPKILDHLVEPIKERIYLNSYVKKINWNTNEDASEGAVIEIKLGNGDDEECKVSCRRVIVTIQSHLLLESPHLFEPAVPEYKLDAWRTVPAVDYCRLIARFPKVFWPSQSEWLVNVTSNPTSELNLWQNLAGQNYLNADPNVLVCHLSTSLASPTSHSPRGIHFARLSNTELIETIYQSMIKMFPNEQVEPNGDDCRRPCAALLISHWSDPNQSDNNNQNEAMRWWGAFSYVGIGFEPMQTESDLRKGFGGQSDEVVLFAGESTKPTMIGTLQGAFVSGRDSAMKCLNNLNLE